MQLKLSSAFAGIIVGRGKPIAYKRTSQSLVAQLIATQTTVDNCSHVAAKQGGAMAPTHEPQAANGPHALWTIGLQKLKAGLSRILPTEPQAKTVQPRRWLAQARQLHAETEERYHLWLEKSLNAIFSRSRHQYFRDLAIEPDALVISDRDRLINRQIARLTLITTLAAIGQLFSPALLLTATVLAYATIYSTAKYVWQIWRQERRLVKEAVQLGFHLGSFASGYLVVGSLVSIFVRFVEKFTRQTRDQSRKNLAAVFGQQPRTVWLVVNDVEIEVPFEQIQEGDTLAVQAGQMIPVDGVITEGLASVDQQRLTGEARPVEKEVGDRVLAAALVLTGRIRVRVEKTGVDTLAAQIGEMLKRATDYHLMRKEQGEKLAEQWVIPTFLLSGLAFLTLGAQSAVAVLGNSPGLGMIVVGPLTLLNYLNLTTRQKILIKDGRSLELLREVDTVVFDKTGTLTLDEFEVSQIHPNAAYSVDQVLTYAATAEQRQSHPLAKAIVAAAQQRHLPLPTLIDTHYEIGYGLKVWLPGEWGDGPMVMAHEAAATAKQNARLVRVGSERFMALEGLSVPAELLTCYHAGQAQGHSLVFVAVDETLAGVIELQPTIRPEAKAVIKALHQRGLKTFIISGDQEEPTRKLASELGIDHYFANVLPQQKAELVAQLHAEGRMICFVGDGINDALALKKAQVSISLRGATSVATDTAQIVLMDQSLRQLPDLFALAHEMYRNLTLSYLLTTMPALIMIVGVFIAHVSIPTVMVVRSLSLVAGVANGIAPMLKRRLTNNDLKLENDTHEQHRK